KPADDPEAIGDPYKTLFISRLSKNATEEDLRKEFGSYGRIDSIRLVKNKRGHSRGYAFIVYDREKDMKAAYKEADGLTILGKRILVDVERGRTVRGWKPRRLGGGLGGRPKPVAPAAAAEPSRFGPPGGGFRGGHGGDRGGRGGFRGGFGDRPGGFRGGRGGGYGGGRGGGGGGGGFGGDRGYGDRGGGGDRGYGGGGDRGYGGMNGDGGGRGGYGGGGGGGGDRGGYGPRGGGGGYGGDSGYGGRNDSGGGGHGPGRGRGGGIGFQGGFGGHQDGGYQNAGGGGGYGGGQDNGYPSKRGYDDGADRDSKRTRY
ncbi:hypothetical protein FRC09_002277, partial [Ceratobasidium sp. 395]